MPEFLELLEKKTQINHYQKIAKFFSSISRIYDRREQTAAQIEISAAQTLIANQKLSQLILSSVYRPKIIDRFNRPFWLYLTETV
jgi:hypothetical protein